MAFPEISKMYAQNGNCCTSSPESGIFNPPSTASSQPEQLRGKCDSEMEGSEANLLEILSGFLGGKIWNSIFR